MARLNKALNLQPCNSLLAKMIHIGEERIALMDFEHIVHMGIVLDVYMISVTLLKNHIRMRGIHRLFKYKTFDDNLKELLG